MWAYWCMIRTIYVFLSKISCVVPLDELASHERTWAEIAVKRRHPT